MTPSSGEALVTYFQFSVAGWNDVPEDLPLTTSFGYRLGASDSVTWAITTTDEDPTAELVLPGGTNGEEREGGREGQKKRGRRERKEIVKGLRERTKGR